MNCAEKLLPWLLLGLRWVSEYSDIQGSDKKIEYEYSSMPKLLDRDFFSSPPPPPPN